jgi:hypothetical protein
MRTTLINIATKFFIAFMAVQIINLSIDAVEFEPLCATNDLGNFNYMNSMTEYVTEILLNHKDAFPEYQKTHTSSKAQLVKHIPFKIIPINGIVRVKKRDLNNSNYIHPLNENRTYSYIREINPPPPKSNVI